MIDFLQIVPHFVPGEEAVSTIASELAERLASGGAKVGIVAGARDVSTSHVAASVPGGTEKPLSLRVLQNVEGVHSGGGVLLHFVGYGYHPRGIPRDLVASWERVRSLRPDLRLGVLFHEVRSSGPPWRSSFWLRPVQDSLARRLLKASDAVSTSLSRYCDFLASLNPGQKIDLLPCPSTVGEPGARLDALPRATRLVVFGSSGVRRRAYERERRTLERTLEQLGITELVDIGDNAGAPRAIGGVQVQAVGRVPAEEVSRWLLSSRFGFLAYPPDYLDKSTIFSAYLAHGLAPLCAWRGRRGRAPLSHEPWIRATASGVEDFGPWESASARAREAYSSRSIRRHAELWQERLLAT